MQSALRQQDEEHESVINELKAQHKREVVYAKAEARSEGMAVAIHAGAATPSIAPSPVPLLDTLASNAKPKLKTPMLGAVVDDFLKGFKPDRKAEMRKKHSVVLPLFLLLVGDRRVSDIKQADVNNFFALIQKLPPRWKELANRTGASPVELATKSHAATMAPKTFDDTYKACIRSFLTASVRDWQDQGFPTTLTVQGIEYQGERADGESKQRAFKPPELKRLFEGAEMRLLGNSAATLHKFWLPLLGLFTGARVNELCQLNPQSDIADQAGIWHFKFSEDGESAPGIDKRIKNKSSVRLVPIHSKLIELGFLDHVKSLREAKAKQLFPEWIPKGGKASPNAERWFKRFLVQVGLRDETPGARLVGMHAFRHTFLARAQDLDIDRATVITGHVGDESVVVRGYQGELALARKRDIIEKITFDVSFEKPGATPAPTTVKPRRRTHKSR